MINENLLRGKWKEIKGDIQKKWGNLTDDDLEGTKGDFKSIAGVIQQKYGTAQEEVRKGLNDLFVKFTDSTKGKTQTTDNATIEEQPKTQNH
jgi:uncharacterized protein YjbJ (UPF0337 family)